MDSIFRSFSNSNIQIFNNNQDKRKDGCPECSGILKEEGCVYELCEKHWEKFKGKLSE